MCIPFFLREYTMRLKASISCVTRPHGIVPAIRIGAAKDIIGSTLKGIWGGVIVICSFNYASNIVIIWLYILDPRIIRINVQLLGDKMHIIAIPREVNLIKRLACCIKIDPHKAATIGASTDKLHIVTSLLHLACQ